MEDECDAILSPQDQRLAELFAAGETTEKICRETGLTRRAIYVGLSFPCR